MHVVSGCSKVQRGVTNSYIIHYYVLYLFAWKRESLDKRNYYLMVFGLNFPFFNYGCILD